MVLLLFDGNDVGTAHPECIVTHVRNFLFFSNHSCRTCLSIILLPSPFGEGIGGEAVSFTARQTSLPLSPV